MIFYKQTLNFIIFTTVLLTLSVLVTSCGGGERGKNLSSADTPENPSKPGGNCTSTSTISTATYKISWNPVSDVDLVGYKVYYGKAGSLNKSTSKSENLAVVTDWDLNPTALGFEPCDNVQIAITSVGGTKSESSLSKFITIMIE